MASRGARVASLRRFEQSLAPALSKALSRHRGAKGRRSCVHAQEGDRKAILTTPTASEDGEQLHLPTPAEKHATEKQDADAEDSGRTPPKRRVPLFFHEGSTIPHVQQSSSQANETTSHLQLRHARGLVGASTGRSRVRSRVSNRVRFTIELN